MTRSAKAGLERVVSPCKGSWAAVSQCLFRLPLRIFHSALHLFRPCVLPSSTTSARSTDGQTGTSLHQPLPPLCSHSVRHERSPRCTLEGHLSTSKFRAIRAMFEDYSGLTIRFGARWGFLAAFHANSCRSGPPRTLWGVLGDRRTRTQELHHNAGRDV